MEGLLALAILTAIGNNWLQLSAVDVESSRLPASFEGYCIIQISDLHGHRFGWNQSRLVKKTRAAHPDLIVITGDLTRWGRWNMDHVDGLAYQMRDIAPTYFITGNHDHYARDLPELLDRLEAAGVRVLAGTSVQVARGSESITLAGIQDPRYFRRDEGGFEAAKRWESALQALLSTVDPEKYTLLLSHRPEFLAEYERLGLDLVFAGHAHGGQVRLPIIGGLYSPDQGWLPRITSGLYRRGGTALVVSRGLGNSIFPVRVLNRPELVVVRLRRTSS